MLFSMVACAGGGAPVTTEPVTEAPPPPEVVIYLDGENGKDENDGLTEAAAVATYEAAFKLLSEERKKIVIVNTVTVDLNDSLPEYDGEVVFTSVHDGVNYAEKNNAALRI